MENKEPNGPLSWEEAIDAKCEQYGFRVPYDGIDNFYDKEAIQHFRNGADWSKEFFTSRVQALEEENQEWKQHTKRMIDRLELVEGENWNLKEENKRLQERLSAAEEVIKAQKDFYNSMHGREIVADLSKELVMNEAIQKYNSLKK